MTTKLYSRLLTGLTVVLFVLGLAMPAGAKEQVEEFLDKLRERGYGEVMIDYVDYLQKKKLLTAEQAENLDLYLSQAWRLSVAEAFNPTEAEQRTAKSKEYLDKYVKAHPDSSALAEEMAEWADISLKQGLKLLGLARIAKEPEKKAQFNSEARQALEDARPRFETAVDFFAKKMADLDASAPAAKKGKRPPVNPNQEKRDRAEILWLDSKFKLAKVKFFIAQTFVADETEEGKKHRKELLDAAAPEFYDIYQRYRVGVGGLLAHVWEGKTREELGDLSTAEEIYEEVLVSMPTEAREIDKIDPAQKSMFAQVQYFAFQIMLKQAGPKEFMTEAQQFLTTYAKWKNTDGYQGVSLEVAKVLMEEMEKAPAEQKAKMKKELETILKESKKVRSEHYAEFAELDKRIHRGGVPVGEPKTWEEAIAQGDNFSDPESQKWEDAEKAYQKAMELSEKVTANKRKKIQADIQEKLDTVHYNLAFSQYKTGKDADAITQIQELIPKLDAKSELAIRAASLWVSAALRRYATTQEKEAKAEALEGLTAAANHVIETWPDKAEADDARIALGQASLVQGDVESALKAFEGVNPRSLRYPMAQHVAAQTHLRLYDQANKAGDKESAKTTKKELGTAQEELERSVELQAKALVEAKDKATPQAAQQLQDTQLMLAQVYSISNQPLKVAELLQPALDAIKAAKPQKLDPNMLKMFTLAVKAYVANGDMTKGGEVATALTDLGEDATDINTVLVQFAQMLDNEYKAANAALIEARAENDPSAKEAAEKRLEGTKELLGKLVDRLAPRQNNTPKAMILIGRMAANIGETDKASEIFNRILELSSSNEEYAAQCPKDLLISVQAQLIDILGKKGQYEEGVKQVDSLIEKVPKALEPLMSKGRLLQAWAEKDPTKFPDAVSHWSSLRAKISPLANKAGTPADIKANYYEVNYNVAYCLFLDSQKTNDPAKALDARKVLNALLITTPKLNGPEMVAKYKDLLRKIEKAAGTPAKAAGQPAPKTDAKG